MKIYQFIHLYVISGIKLMDFI